MSDLGDFLHKLIDAIDRPSDVPKEELHKEVDDLVKEEAPSEASPPAEEPPAEDPTPASSDEPAPTADAPAPTDIFTPAPQPFGTEGQPG